MLFSLSLIIVFSFVFMFSGLIGLFFITKSIFFSIISIEIIFLTINMNFLFFSVFLDSNQGLVFIFYIIVISAAEITILLSYFILFLKKIKLFDSNEKFKNLKH